MLRHLFEIKLYIMSRQNLINKLKFNINCYSHEDVQLRIILVCGKIELSADVEPIVTVVR